MYKRQGLNVKTPFLKRRGGVFSLFAYNNVKETVIEKIISGGQTGADRAAVDVAIEFAVVHAGWVPRGPKTENGRLPEKYNLQEFFSISYPQRTELNLLDSDAERSDPLWRRQEKVCQLPDGR